MALKQTVNAGVSPSSSLLEYVTALVTLIAMHLLGLLDNWTLMVAIALTTSMATFAFGMTWGTHRSLQGSGEFALAFFTGTLTCVLFTLVPDTTPVLRFCNTVLGDSLMPLVYALLLAGVEHFFRVRRLARFGYVLVAIVFALTWYFTSVRDSITARMLVDDVSTLIFRVLIGVELLRHAPQRHLRTLSALMFLFAGVSAVTLWDTLAHAGPRNANEWMHGHSHQQISLLATLFFFVAVGQLLFLILNGGLVRQLEEEATRDFMTGTLNRRGIERTLEAEMARSHRNGHALSVGIIDVDSFKQINDTLGHAEGDRTLIAVSHAIRDGLRLYDSVGRLGGDEFLVLLPDTPQPEAFRVMERLRETTAALESNGATLSVGLTSIARGETSRALLARADAALYQAKQDGRNRTRNLIPAAQTTVNAPPADASGRRPVAPPKPGRLRRLRRGFRRRDGSGR